MQAVWDWEAGSSSAMGVAQGAQSQLGGQQGSLLLPVSTAARVSKLDVAQNTSHG